MQEDGSLRGKMGSCPGTIGLMAPELVCPRRGDVAAVTPASDVAALAYLTLEAFGIRRQRLAFPEPCYTECALTPSCLCTVDERSANVGRRSASTPLTHTWRAGST